MYKRQALDNAIPPPTKNNTPQGILLADSQLHALLFFPVGIIKSIIAPKILIEVSLRFKPNKLFNTFLNIHKLAVRKKIMATTFSFVLAYPIF